MDETERLVEDHLKHCGYSQIEFEPDGNVPPDFLVDNRIAIEVRRLNQNHFKIKQDTPILEVPVKSRVLANVLIVRINH